VPAGQCTPGDIVRYNGRRLYAAAVNLADRVALEPLGPGDRRGGMQGESTWLQLTDEVEILERFRVGADAGGEVDPLRSGGGASALL
jgi:hypothetical protein